MFKRSLKFLILSLLICANTFSASSYPIAVEKVLLKVDKNSAELKKVLEHYRNDSLRYKAACFLIGNMDIHESRSYYWADTLNKNIHFNELSFANYETAIKEFNILNGKTRLHAITQKTLDFQTLTSNYLIQNIDKAFEVKNTNWAKDISFDLFCEYILPYKVLNEPYAEWRDAYRKEFTEFTTPLAEVGVRKVCTSLSNNLRSWFFNTYNLKIKKESPAFLSPTQLLFRRQGTCEDMANWGVYILRSMGIAASIDFTPAWATSTGSHYWNVAFDESSSPIPFFMGDDNPDEFRMVREPSKVLRITYGKQNNALANKVAKTEIPESYLRNFNYLDVTRDYWKVANLSITLKHNSIPLKTAYITVFNGMSWKPVWWSAIQQSKATFTDLAVGVVYLPMYYSKDKLIPAHTPCILRPDGSIEELKTNVTDTRTVIIEQQKGYLLFRPGKKYSLYYWDNKWQKAGEQVANTATQLIFEKVPGNALMLLIPEYSEGKERPFTINTNGLREWW